MIEKIYLDYLTERLDVPVYMEEPTEDLTDYVLIEKVGSSESNHIPTATLVFQSYGASLYDAALRNLLVKTLVANSVELDEISAVRLNSDYNFTDTTTKKYRYQALFVVTYLED
jgi:hypothetical protein